MIPKIIHHIAPADQGSWHPLWDRCWPTWQKNFADYEHKLWSDTNDIDALVRDHFPEYWSTYQAFPFHIMRIDFAKLCILYKHGGIYADMDIFCYSDFRDQLDRPVCLLECFGKKNYHFDDGSTLELENSLMASVPGHAFFDSCMRATKSKFDYAKKNFWNKEDVRFGIIGSFEDNFNARLIEEITGSYMIKEVYEDCFAKAEIGILNKDEYTNIHNYEPNEIYHTLHLYTAYWGKDMMEFLEQQGIIDPNLPEKEKLDSHFFHGYEDKQMMRNLLERMLNKDV